MIGVSHVRQKINLLHLFKSTAILKGINNIIFFLSSTLMAEFYNESPLIKIKCLPNLHFFSGWEAEAKVYSLPRGDIHA